VHDNTIKKEFDEMAGELIALHYKESAEIIGRYQPYDQWHFLESLLRNCVEKIKKEAIPIPLGREIVGFLLSLKDIHVTYEQLNEIITNTPEEKFWDAVEKVHDKMVRQKLNTMCERKLRKGPTQWRSPQTKMGEGGNVAKKIHYFEDVSLSQSPRRKPTSPTQKYGSPVRNRSPLRPMNHHGSLTPVFTPPNRQKGQLEFPTFPREKAS
jgi:hypothetical protein